MLTHTNLPVPKLSFGAAALGGVYDRSDDHEATLTIRAAVDAGLNLIDTSPYYGLGRSEKVLGRVLPGLPRDSFILSTKCGRYGTDEFDFSPPRLERSIDESLSRLGLEHVDILLLHDVEFADLNSIIHDSIPALERIKQAGKTRFIGFSALPLQVFQTIIPQVPQAIDIVLSYCHYNLFDSTLLDLVPLLNHHRVDLVNAAPTSMGLLTSKGPPDWHPASPRLKGLCAEAARYCSERGVEIADLAVAFACSHPEIPTTLVGTENRRRLERNIEIAANPVDTALLAEVQSILGPIRNHTWSSGRVQQPTTNQ